MLNRITKILLGLGLSITLTSCAITTVKVKPIFHPALPTKMTTATLSKNIRVALIKNTKRVSISCVQPIAIYDLSSKKKIDTIYTDAKTPWQFKQGGIVNGRKRYQPNSIRLVVPVGSFIKVNNIHYRGQLTLTTTPNQGMHVINILPLEDYLQGVVPNEVLAKWPEEVLKAQAVTARTFAIYKMSGRVNKAFDLDASVNSQVYRGLTSENEATNRAVQATKGQIASYRNKVIAAFYHSNCGGHTADSRYVWGSDIDYLHGTRCRYCESGPHFKWTYQVSKKKLEKILKKHNYNVVQLHSIRLKGRDNSNRIKAIEIKHQQGKLSIKSSAFRMAVGADKIRSTNFYTDVSGKKITFYGRGWGHGVGLCQEGAMALAKNGYSYGEIVTFYYPGTQVTKLGH